MLETDAQRTVFMLLDHVGGTGNVTLTSSGVSTATSGRCSAAWYTFAPRSTHAPIADLKSLRFVVDGKLEDQSGVGFAVQDGVVFSETSCYTHHALPYKGQLDVAIRKGLDPSRVFLVQLGAEDNFKRKIIVETNVLPLPMPTTRYGLSTATFSGLRSTGSSSREMMLLKLRCTVTSRHSAASQFAAVTMYWLDMAPSVRLQTVGTASNIQPQ
ncbi:hypothetical protein DFH08DRAFT_819683 [Mycena albidolilacea]|uniref:Uncharacterized protein n=1 Tax=Mycena albidolilacea TaxID=1033008 RepID=A0AAD6ZEE2_9AGAR|nr:hypothetical protein DFH08DRAFT_819683 [Mycena albidolilacea]